ncbi:hypothetical protein [Humidisolicoccus flavus]|uniref:hypothetical protein n=1 Tax=Humidisolicoccus flavus TaxID=3111414 RepID=UPI00324D7076
MWIRRALFWVFLASVIALPLWVMFGRGFFGAPLGTALVLQTFLMPGLAILIGSVVGVTVARKSVRSKRAIEWGDALRIGPWWLAIVLLAFFVVDSSGGREGSVLTQWFGPQALGISSAATLVLTLAIVIGAGVLFVAQLRALGRETKQRMESYVNAMTQQSGTPIQAEAFFEKTDGPQAGRTIRIERGDLDGSS